MNKKLKSEDWDFSDLVTPEYDEMILWLLDKNNMKKLIAVPYQITFEELLTEVPVKANNGYILGYIDVVTKLLFWKKEHDYELKENYYGKEYVCKVCECSKDEQEKKCIVGRQRIAVEVKPKIDSFGALVRQINKYKAVTDYKLWFVVTQSPSSRKYKDALKGQGIELIILPKNKVVAEENQLPLNI